MLQFQVAAAKLAVGAVRRRQRATFAFNAEGFAIGLDDKRSDGTIVRGTEAAQEVIAGPTRGSRRTDDENAGDEG